MRYLTIGFFLIAMLGCSVSYKAEAERITATTEVLLPEQNFEELYKNLDDTAKSLTPKSEFLERADTLLAAMKKVDPDLAL